MSESPPRASSSSSLPSADLVGGREEGPSRREEEGPPQYQQISYIQGIGNMPSSAPGHDENIDAVTEVMLEFQAVTGMEDMEESRRILDAHGWDLLAAISSHLDGAGSGNNEGSQRMNDLSPPSPPPASASSLRRRRQDEDNQLPVNNNNNGGRVVPPSPARSGLFSYIWTLLTRPMDYVFRFIWDFLSVGFGVLGITNNAGRRAIVQGGDPSADVALFKQQYEEKYGLEHPPFYQASYSAALTEAKRDLKFLLVYLHCEDHEDTSIFCRRVLPNASFQAFLREKSVLFWACSVSTAEGYKTSQALRENSYPFLALIVLKNNKMTIVKRIEGELDPTVILTRLSAGITDNEAFLVVARQERFERSATQTLRQQQDEAYLASLKADQEKERKREEEAKKRKEEEEEEKRKVHEEVARVEELKRSKITARETLPKEPTQTDSNAIRTIIKLPNGTRLERRFLKTDKLSLLHQFVFSHSEAPNVFEIATNFPKKVLPCGNGEESAVSFLEFGLGKNEMLFVYDLES